MLLFLQRNTPKVKTSVGMEEGRAVKSGEEGAASPEFDALVAEMRAVLSTGGADSATAVAKKAADRLSGLEKD